MSRPSRAASSSPAWGPEPVTSVPVYDRDPGQREVQQDELPSGLRDHRHPRHAVRFTGAADQRGAGDDERHRQQQVTLHRAAGAGRPARRCRRGPRCATTPTTSSQAIPTRSLPARHPAVRTEDREDHGDGDDTGEQPVDLLNGRVLGRDVDEAFTGAVRPVVAAEPTPGEPDGRPGHDDDGEEHQGRDGDLAVPAWGQLHHATSLRDRLGSGPVLRPSDQGPWCDRRHTCSLDPCWIGYVAASTAAGPNGANAAPHTRSPGC